MKNLLVLFLFYYLTSGAPFGPNTVAFGAFNVQIFGLSKMASPGVPSTLVSVFRRWDIGLIQEIRDASSTAVFELLEAINNYTGPQYSLILSPRLGRNTSTTREQYGFFYRKDTITVLDSYLYNDVNDVFEREPFPVLFKLLDGTKFFVIPCHTKPTDAVSEIQYLPRVYDDAISRWAFRWETNMGIIAGDLNAGCSYVTSKDWPNIALKSNSSFQWLISDDADTTIGITECPYDRIIISQDTSDIIVADSADTYDYVSDLNLNISFAQLVSDHYPVEVGLKVQSPTGSGVIIGVTVGVFTILIIVVIVLALFQRYQKNKRNHISITATPLIEDDQLEY